MKDNVIKKNPATRAVVARGPAAVRLDGARDLRVLQRLHQIDERRHAGLDELLEPAATWNMLAELLRARITRRPISVTSLCLASRAPATTALRRLQRLLHDGVITYAPDPRDRRRKYVELTTEGAERVQEAVRGVAPHLPAER